MPLTPKQIKFVDAYARLKKPIEAYRNAYKTGNKSDNVIYKRASALLNKDEIKAHLSLIERQENLPLPPLPSDTPVTDLNRDRILFMLTETYDKACDDKRGASAMISACLAIAKINGVLNDTDHKSAETPHFKALIRDIRKARTRLHKTSQKNIATDISQHTQ